MEDHKSEYWNFFLQSSFFIFKILENLLCFLCGGIPFLFFQGGFFQKFCPYIWLLFRGGLFSRPGYDGALMPYNSSAFFQCTVVRSYYWKKADVIGFSLALTGLKIRYTLLLFGRMCCLFPVKECEKCNNYNTCTFVSPGVEVLFSGSFFSDNEFKPKVVETPKGLGINFLWVCKLMF